MRLTCYMLLTCSGAKCLHVTCYMWVRGPIVGARRAIKRAQNMRAPASFGITPTTASVTQRTGTAGVGDPAKDVGGVGSALTDSAIS